MPPTTPRGTSSTDARFFGLYANTPGLVYGPTSEDIHGYDERVNHPERLMYPQVRWGVKGAGEFRRASWAEALDLVATRLRTVSDRHGAAAILPYHYAGPKGLRQIGSAMGHHCSSGPSWRVLKASGDAPPGHEREALTLYILEGTPLLGNYAEYLRTGEGRWRVDLMAARWAPGDGEFDRIDAVAERLERSLHKLSAPDDEMTV